MCHRVWITYNVAQVLALDDSDEKLGRTGYMYHLLMMNWLKFQLAAS